MPAIGYGDSVTGITASAGAGSGDEKVITGAVLSCSAVSAAVTVLPAVSLAVTVI
ncbi:MAG: hypothetical protein GY820_22035 [Gammaproteobacteria bacterium]|nr:hypothetical protein [Gammaproteobacteria bacterium]